VRRDALLLTVLNAVVLSGAGACRRSESTPVGEGSAATLSAPKPAVPTSSAALLGERSEPAQAPPPTPPEKPRVYIKNRFVFVRPRPDVNADWLGFLWFGASVELRSTVPQGGPGCAKFYAIEPMGFVCVDDKQATLAADDPVFNAVARYAPRLEQAAPHRYAESIGAALVSQLPGNAPSWPALPEFFHEPRRRLLPLSTLAYADERVVAGQPWLLSADLLWLKKEQVTLYPEITFHGVELGAEIDLPLAFFRNAGSHKYRRSAAGKLEKSEERFRVHDVVALGSRVEIQRGERYFETRSGGDWVREREAVLPVPRSVTPWGAHVGQADAPPGSALTGKNAQQTWFEVSVLGGWLLAFKGTRPVYATLVSPGRGGIPQEGKNTLEIAATPLGTFPISGKLATVTMQAPGEYTHSDVPWTQNFQKPYAIHTAYWHDNWGNLQSGGCINVSPIDGKWLFDFSEPRLPAGWHAVRWQPSTGAPTLLVVHE
jgi:L,D-transpeptidase catalytic domain